MVVSVHWLIKPQDENEKFVQKQIAGEVIFKDEDPSEHMIATFPKAGSKQELGICMISWEGRWIKQGLISLFSWPVKHAAWQSLSPPLLLTVLCAFQSQGGGGHNPPCQVGL